MFHVVRGSAYLLLLVHQSCDHVYIHCIFSSLYVDICLFHLPLHVFFLFYLYTHVSYLLYAIYYFYLTLKCLDEFCLKYFKNTVCQSLPCYELSSCKVFQEFVLG